MNDLSKHISVSGQCDTFHINKPLVLNKPGLMYLVESGTLNLCITRLAEGSPVGPRHFLHQVQAGDTIPTAGPSTPEGHAFVLFPNQEAQVYEILLGELLPRYQDSQKLVYDTTACWVQMLYVGLAQANTDLRPQTDALLQTGKQDIAAGTVFSIGASDIGWAWAEPAEALRFFGQGKPYASGRQLIPLSKKAYFSADQDLVVELYPADHLPTANDMLQALAVFEQQVLAHGLHEISALAQEEQQLTQARMDAQAAHVEGNMRHVAAILNNAEDDLLAGLSHETNNPLFNACSIIARFEGFELVLPPNFDESNDPLDDLTRFSRIRYREILLEDGWQEKDGSPLLAFWQESNDAVALLPKGQGGYELVDPAQPTKEAVTPALAAMLRPAAFQFYKPLPRRKIKLMDLAVFGLLKDRRDYWRLLGMGALTSLLGLLSPGLTAVIFDDIIPEADRSNLAYIALALLMAAMGSILFGVTRSFALLRIEGKTDALLQSAVWDRLLDLPTRFFRDYSAGDLASRSMGINRIRQVLTGVVVSSVLGGIFSIFNFGLLFYFSLPLALIALLLVAIEILVLYVLGRLQLVQQTVYYEKSGIATGIVLQLLGGIPKFRVTGTEVRAFMHWLKHFADTQAASLKNARLQNVQHVFSSAFGLFGTIVIYFGLIKLTGEKHLTTGQFLAFLAAYGSFAAAMLSTSNALLTFIQVVPLYDRLKPILEELPENDGQKTAPTKLRGGIELNYLNFRYDAEGPLIINDVGLNIEPGEFVALVGPSGSGKSTLLRLLLGFEKASSGRILYDGQDLSLLDTQLLRRQIGVVLQDGKLIPGDIFTNIVGSSAHLTHNDAMEAVRAVGFEEDLKQMPMGLHTMVSEGAGTLSGGQRQRLMIARAIVHRPKILFFDEATSALDNRTQAVVTESLNQLQVTRVVVAHRLSTIIDADKICYLENGKLLESGSYAELMEKNGRFARLAERQVE